MEIFEEASRTKLRFPSPKGLLTAEDLWDIPLRGNLGNANLNDIAKALNKELREAEQEDFVQVPGRVAKASIFNPALGLDIVKHVIAVRQAESADLAAAAERKEEKQKLLALLDRKKDESLNSLSEDELKARIAAL